MTETAEATSPSKPGPIVLYGASGFTGKLIAAELCARGLDFTLAGRSREKLDAVAAELARPQTVAAVALDDPAAVRSLLEPAAVVIGCAGPFTLHGRPLIEAAAATGTNYLDTTGEQPFIRDSFEVHGAAAEASGAALASGMGFDYAPGDMLAALVAAGLGRLREMTVAYAVRGFGPTRGTALSALEMMSGGDLEWRDGSRRTAPRHVGEGRYEFPSPIGSRRVGRYPCGETITVPRHVETDSMRCVIDLRGLTGMQLGPLSAPAMTLSGLLMVGPARRAAGKLISRMPEGPSERARGAVRFTVACEAETADGRRRRGVVRGSDIYGLTAAIIAEGAARMASPDYDRRSALAPAQAFDPESFLNALAPFGVSYELEEVRGR
ncbi:MAG: saccharopine dehydrogenase NADP-binding domain-containing protein [Solirubrobacterales bacterium]